jgi:Flp pilus assembly pilin Flp
MEKAHLASLKKSRKIGASMVEYALLVLLIALALVAVIGAMSEGLKKPFSEVTSAL